VHDVAVKTMAAVELSRMALDKAADPNIHVFAQMMIDEHGAAGDKLKSVVSGQRIEWPAQLDEKRRRTADELKKNQGRNFDRDYMEAMVEGHQDRPLVDPRRADTSLVAQKHLDTARTLENAAKQRSPK